MAEFVEEQNYENQRTKFQPMLAANLSTTRTQARPNARVQYVDF
jgi:hypothetical protein